MSNHKHPFCGDFGSVAEIIYVLLMSVFLAYVLSTSAAFAFLLKAVVIVVEKLASLPNADAISESVFNVVGAEFTNALIDFATNSVEAIVLDEFP